MERLKNKQPEPEEQEDETLENPYPDDYEKIKDVIPKTSRKPRTEKQIEASKRNFAEANRKRAESSAKKKGDKELAVKLLEAKNLLDKHGEDYNTFGDKTKVAAEKTVRGRGRPKRKPEPVQEEEEEEEEESSDESVRSESPKRLEKPVKMKKKKPPVSESESESSVSSDSSYEVVRVRKQKRNIPAPIKKPLFL